MRKKPRLLCQVPGRITDATIVQPQCAQIQLHVWLESKHIPSLSWQLTSVSFWKTLTDLNTEGAPVPSPSLALSIYYSETQISCPVN